MSENTNKEKKVIDEIRHALEMRNYKAVHHKIEELKTSGKESILPGLLDLLVTDCPESIKQDILTLTNELKHQGCVPIIIDYISNRKVGEYLSKLIESCWQSSLDFSNYLEVFADCFVTGNYQTALESFTVIEEMLWRSNAETIESCRHFLMNKLSEVATDKKTLFNELIKLLDEGRTANTEDFPDLYLN